MATVVSRASQTSSGIGFVVRNPTVGDAEAWIDHAVAVMQESDFTKTEPEDLVSSLQEQEAWIAAMNAHVGNLALVAEIEGHLVGILYCRAFTSRRMAHVCAFAMSVRRQWWGQGVGTSLVQCLVDWARALQGLGRFVEAHEKYELVLREGVTSTSPKSPFSIMRRICWVAG